MKNAIQDAVNKFLELTKDKKIKVISHFDTDGISSAAIMTKTLQRLNKEFSVKIIKSLDKEFLSNLKIQQNEVLVFLDLASSSLDTIGGYSCQVFILDHHEICSSCQSNTIFINPHLFDNQEISAAGLTYLFAKAIDPKNTDLANLAVIGMVGDMLDKNLSKLNNEILEDAEMVIKKGLLLYPATRPVHKTLEFSSGMFIPGVTGDYRGVLEMLREADIKKEGPNWKSLIELSEEELSRLITAIILRTKKSGSDLIGNIYLVKFFNKLEDARELSALINACSRLGHSNVSLSFCLGNKEAMKKAEEIYAEYKQQLVAALNYAAQNKIEGKDYVIINARNEIKDTIIGTVASITSMSHGLKEGTVVIALAYDNDRIKVSARIAGRNQSSRNAREILEAATDKIGAECGGHQMAAGCLISQTHEKLFLDNIVKNLEIEMIKV